MWDLPGPGLEPVSPALAGRFLTTVPPGKSLKLLVIIVATEMTTSFFNHIRWMGGLCLVMGGFDHTISLKAQLQEQNA